MTDEKRGLAKRVEDVHNTQDTVEKSEKTAALMFAMWQLQHDERDTKRRDYV